MLIRAGWATRSSTTAALISWFSMTPPGGGVAQNFALAPAGGSIAYLDVDSRACRKSTTPGGNSALQCLPSI